MRPRAARLAIATAIVLLGGAPTGACPAIAPGVDLQARIDGARDGDTLCLAPGLHRGPLRIDRAIDLRGGPDAVLASTGSGSTIALEADGARLSGITIDGSGGRFDLLDAAVRVGADRVRVEGVTVRNALFGILVERSREVVLRDNRIEGDPAKPLGMRGDGIRLWEVRASRVENNRLTHSRDVVIWYSPGNVVSGNRVTGGRYGTHLMYSHGNRVERNRFVGNVVGIFAMYSRDLEVTGNLIARSTGAAGVGLGAKESGAIRVTDNWFLANTVGAYLDTSPLEPADHNRFDGNVFRFSEAAVVFHGEAHRNAFRDNHFGDNGIAVRVEGRGDAQDAVWEGNHYDDYAGYDLDGDGRGDLPYELRSLSSTLESRRPSLAFFRGGVAMSLVELAGEALPLFRPRTLMRDPSPRMHPRARPRPVEDPT